MANERAKGPKYQIVEGIKFPPKLPTENIKSGLKYKPKDADLFVVTYMKSGTTWVQQICTLILFDGEIPSVMKEKGLYHMSPFLEWVGAEHIYAMPDPKVIKTHLPFEATPYNLKAKYIYVARNPKDVLISLYHHVMLFPGYEFNGTVHDLLLVFMEGDLDYGSYVHHILSWWSHRNDPNVLFLLYEDMKADIRESVLKIAAFMGDEYKRKIDENPDILEKVVNQSDISFMKQTTNNDLQKLWNEFGILYKDREFNFIRKGIIGDWRNHLTEEDNKEFEKWFQESFKNTGIYNLWDQYLVFQFNK